MRAALLVATSLALCACDSGRSELAKCSSVCGEMEQEQRAYCKESDPQSCYDELKKATEACESYCKLQTR